MSKSYAISGAATGIGAEVKRILQQRGDSVITIDIAESDISADLSRSENRAQALLKLGEKAPDGLDGFVACAGVGPYTQPPSLIDRINFFGAVDLLEGVSELVAKKRGAMVAVSSSSALLPGLNEEHIQCLLERDEPKACAMVDELDGLTAYTGSKNALIRWVRKESAALLAQGVRVNAVVPGATETPLMDKLLADENFGASTRDFNGMIPYGSPASPDMIADCIVFLLGEESRYVNGTALIVDGGQDALLRPHSF